MVVAGVTGASRVPMAVRRRAEGGVFSLAPERAEMAEGAGSAAAVPITSLLAMQEAGCQAVQDREARRHGEALLAALAALQRAMLAGDHGAAGELERLMGREVPASDPRLASVVSAIRLRAAVELARTRPGDAGPRHSGPFRSGSV